MERMRVLAAAAALMEFTIPELAAYAGANKDTVRSVLLRDARFFEQRPSRPRDPDLLPLLSGASQAETSTLRGRGRPPMRWRVRDPRSIRQLVADLRSQLASPGAEEPAPGGRGGEVDIERTRNAAMAVAQDALIRAWVQPDPRLRRVLAETVLNSLADAVPPSGGDEVGVDDGLRRRADAIAALARQVDAEARGARVGVDSLAQAAAAVSSLGPRIPAAPFGEFLHRLAERVRPAASAAVLGDIVAARAPVSIDDLAGRRGLPQSELERALEPLVVNKYVIADPESRPHEQLRRGSRVRVNEAERRAIGISIHPNRITGVLTSLGASDSTVLQRELGAGGGLPVDAEVVVEAVSSLVREFRSIRSDVIGLAVDLPGHVNGRAGVVIFSPLLRQRNIPLKRKLEEATGLPTVIENDANALAIREQWFGDGTDNRDFAVVLLSERGGVGSGLVSNNEIVHGATGAAGELGHVRFEADGEECACGQLGCLETVAGVSAILREVRRIGGRAGDLAAAARLAEDDRTFQEVFRAAGNALGWGISVILNLFNPQRVILFAPAELVEHTRFHAARVFVNAVETASSEAAFSTSRRVRPEARPLRDVPPVVSYTLRRAPEPRMAAAAVLNQVFGGPLEWPASHRREVTSSPAR